MHDLLLVLYLTFLVLGNVFLVYAVYTARAAWREDIPPFGRKTSRLQALMFPERFVQPQKVGSVSRLAVAGFILLLLCLVAVITDIILIV